MYWDVLVDKWFIRILIFCIICSIGILLWQQNDMAKFNKKMEAHDAFIAKLENEKNDTKQITDRTITTGEIEHDEWNENEESTFVNVDVEKVPDFATKMIQDDDTTDTSSFKVSTPQVSVSPYGFGPYPEIPEDYPGYPFNNMSANHELIARVKIKLWKQGIRSSGGIIRNGLVYPIIPGKVYVEWKEFTKPDGTVVKTPTRILGDPDDLPRSNESLLEEVIREMKGIPKVIDLPSHLEILSFDEGIDPYDFLDLQ